jgi:response regulator RpfG family c-di-GMP phosphodiesterase
MDFPDFLCFLIFSPAFYPAFEPSLKNKLTAIINGKLMFEIENTNKNVLIVEDEYSTGKLLLEILNSEYECEAVDSAESALEKISKKEYAVILSDINLGGMSGVEMIAEVSFLSPNTVIVLISGQQEIGYAVEAFRRGAFDYIAKPFEIRQIAVSVERAMKHYELKVIKDRYQFHLEELVAERTTELDKALEEVESSYQITLKALVQALEMRDFETHGHAERVVTFSLRLGHELGLDKKELRDLELGALLHDIGKIGVPDHILRKPAKLDENEWVKMRLHPVHGHKILRNIPFLDGASQVVLQHHEKWNGGGYPFGLRGEDINLGARIFAVVDAFDAIVSDRVYRKGRSYGEALSEIRMCSGTQFDPIVVEAFESIAEEDWISLHRRSLSEKREIASLQSVVKELVHSQQQFEIVH